MGYGLQSKETGQLSFLTNFMNVAGSLGNVLNLRLCLCICWISKTFFDWVFWVFSTALHHSWPNAAIASYLKMHLNFTLFIYFYNGVLHFTSVGLLRECWNWPSYSRLWYFSFWHLFFGLLLPQSSCVLIGIFLLVLVFFNPF